MSDFNRELHATESGGMLNLQNLFGGIDIYIFDQLLKGRLRPGTRLLDAGCGDGRNLVYFLRNGYEVCGVDLDPNAVRKVRLLAAELAPATPVESFQVAKVENLMFPDEQFDAVISSAVLHFARDEQHFGQMLAEMWRVLKPGGLFFARLASSIGIEKLVKPLSGRRHLLPDGTERFLVDEPMLLAATERLGGTLIEPLKTTNVQNQRCMTTWVMLKDNRR